MSDHAAAAAAGGSSGAATGDSGSNRKRKKSHKSHGGEGGVFKTKHMLLCTCLYKCLMFKNYLSERKADDFGAIVKQRYNRIIKRLHPDRNTSKKAHAAALILNCAKRTLMDPTLEKGYYFSGKIPCQDNFASDHNCFETRRILGHIEVKMSSDSTSNSAPSSSSSSSSTSTTSSSSAKSNSSNSTTKKPKMVSRETQTSPLRCGKHY